MLKNLDCNKAPTCFVDVPHLILLFFFAALRMEKAEKHRPVDTIFSNIQETEVSLGAASWPPG